MSLIICCGRPRSGITSRANELKLCFEGRGHKVHVINDETLGIQKEDFADKDREKAARAKQMSAVKRLLASDVIVILDSMCYIKGFRYQLFCEAKQAKVTYLVVYMGTPIEQSTQFNKEGTNGWDEKLFDQLNFRFEEPNSMNRWDSPLFIVLPNEKLDFDAIYESTINSKPIKQNHATIKQEVVGDYLSMLNNVTLKLVRQAFQLHQQNPGSTVLLGSRKVELPYSLTMPQLTRIRRNFIMVNKNGKMDEEGVERFFVEFMENNWDVTM